MGQSPLTHADKIKTPLLVVQGANDPRVKKREADQLVIALRDREFLVVPDEGHSIVRPINRMAMLVRTEKFLAKYLGGRYQEFHAPEVSKRLQEITVDPKTVKSANSGGETATVRALNNFRAKSVRVEITLRGANSVRFRPESGIETLP